MIFGIEQNECFALILAYLAGGLTVAAGAIFEQVRTGQYRWRPRMRFRRRRAAETESETA